MKGYDQRLKIYWDNYSVLQTAKKEGREEGREEGRKEGEAEITSKFAKEMKKEGLAIELIAKITKLTKEQIRKL